MATGAGQGAGGGRGQLSREECCGGRAFYTCPPPVCQQGLMEGPELNKGMRWESGPLSCSSRPGPLTWCMLVPGAVGTTEFQPRARGQRRLNIYSELVFWAWLGQSVQRLRDVALKAG